MSEGFQWASDSAVERFVGLNQILPSQYYDVSGGHRLTGEQRLMLALLADADQRLSAGRPCPGNTRKAPALHRRRAMDNGQREMPPRIQLRHRMRRARESTQHAAAGG